MSDSEDSPPPAKQQKLSSSVTEISSEADTSYVDVETQKALEDIDSCQSDIDALTEKASEEILLVEMKYNKLRRPHFEKRNSLIRQLPNFWVTAFLNHPRMANIVEEEEEECLHYLKQIDVEEFEDIKSGYSIRFTFEANPYFSNDVLAKEFHFAPTELTKPRSQSTQIDWKPDMNLTKFVQSKNHKHHRSEGRSFFSWLTENIEPSRDRIAEIIKDDLWPNPLQYFLASDIEVEENGITDSEDEHHIIEDDSVVIVGDDDDELDDDDDVYEVRDDDDDEVESQGEFEETVESIEVEDDDDDDDAIEVLGSDSEAELLQEKSEISEQDNVDTSKTENGDKEDAVSDIIVRGDVVTSVAGENDTVDSEMLNTDGELENNDGNDSDLLRDDDDNDDDGGGGDGVNDDKNGESEKTIKDSAVLKESEKKVADEVEKADDGVD